MGTTDLLGFKPMFPNQYLRNFAVNKPIFTIILISQCQSVKLCLSLDFKIKLQAR